MTARKTDQNTCNKLVMFVRQHDAEAETQKPQRDIMWRLDASVVMEVGPFDSASFRFSGTRKTI